VNIRCGPGRDLLAFRGSGPQEESPMIAKFVRETTTKERIAFALAAFGMLAPLVPWQSL
jgi:hypothetical protein